jgi:hypothetical protein
MKLNDLNHNDPLHELLKHSWEPLPQALEHRLMNIPALSKAEQTRKLDRFVTMLNLVLISWGAGLAIYFRGFLVQLINKFADVSLELGISSVSLINHPLFLLLMLSCISLGVWWLDIGENTS